MDNKNTIYHIVTLDDFKTLTKGNFYEPRNFENDGFIHCTAEKSTSLLVLDDYFSQLSKNHEILILEIDITKLSSEVKFESPAPIPGSGTSHLKKEQLFPHIYGRLNIDAIAGIGKTERVGNKFIWPLTFVQNYF